MVVDAVGRLGKWGGSVHSLTSPLSYYYLAPRKAVYSTPASSLIRCDMVNGVVSKPPVVVDDMTSFKPYE